MEKKTKQKCISHKLALLGGEDWRDEKMRRFTKYKVDGETVLLSYERLNTFEVESLEEKTGYMVIIPRRWGHNMTERWKELREYLLRIIEDTTIYVVVHHYPQAYNIEATIIPVRLDSDASVGKNKGMPFRTIGEAVRYCNNNNIKIRG